MKRLLFVLFFPGALAFSQDLSAVHTVYLLPMAHGLDQYLANRLTNEHVYQVVTDPKRADAIFTDGVGKAFEAKLSDLLPDPEPVSAPANPPAKDEAAPSGPPSLISGSVNKLTNPDSTFRQAKGTVFLVDPKTHQVLWSVYQPLKDSGSSQMDRTASDIVSRLKRDVKPK